MTEFASSHVSSIHSVQSYWGMGVLWTPLASSEDTQGRYSILEELLPASAGPAPHVHDTGEEVFYILEGELALQLNDEVITGTTGHLVRIPPGTTHGFAVKSDTARVLCLCMPAMLDLEISMLTTPTSALTTPPRGSQKQPSDEQSQAFAARLHELATGKWVSEPDLLAEFRVPENIAE